MAAWRARGLRSADGARGQGCRTFFVFGSTPQMTRKFSALVATGAAGREARAHHHGLQRHRGVLHRAPRGRAERLATCAGQHVADVAEHGSNAKPNRSAGSQSTYAEPCRRWRLRHGVGTEQRPSSGRISGSDSTQAHDDGRARSKMGSPTLPIAIVQAPAAARLAEKQQTLATSSLRCATRHARTSADTQPRQASLTVAAVHVVD